MPTAPTLLRTATSEQDKRPHRRPRAAPPPAEGSRAAADQTLAMKMPLGKHTGIYQVHLQAQATLETSTVREAVKLPPHVDRTTWIAAKMLSVYKDAELVVCLLKGEICTRCSCPVMCAGPYVQYSWSDEANPRPVLLSAPDYMERLIAYAHGIIADPEIFPTDMTPSFPADFEQICSKLLKRIFRIYAHTYLGHFEVIRDNGAEAHLNCCFKHLLFFVKEFDLVEPRDLSPLQALIQKFVEAAATSDAIRAAAEAEAEGPSSAAPAARDAARQSRRCETRSSGAGGREGLRRSRPPMDTE